MKDAPLIYRPGTLEDVPRAVDFVSRALQEVEPYGAKVDKVHLARQCMQRGMDPNSLNLLAEKDDEIVGICIAGLCDQIYTPELFSYLFFWYVAPAYRGSMAGPRMIKIMRNWAERKGATKHIAVVNSGVDDEMAGKLLERMGYRRSGTEYVG